MKTFVPAAAPAYPCPSNTPSFPNWPAVRQRLISWGLNGAFLRRFPFAFVLCKQINFSANVTNKSNSPPKMIITFRLVALQGPVTGTDLCILFFNLILEAGPEREGGWGGCPYIYKRAILASRLRKVYDIYFILLRTLKRLSETQLKNIEGSRTVRARSIGRPERGLVKEEFSLFSFSPYDPPEHPPSTASAPR